MVSSVRTVAILLSHLHSAFASLNFLAVGDWGGMGDAPYYTDAQLASASGMNTIASDINATFVLALGDNFYDDGVDENTRDLRFQDTFENVYMGDHLVSLPWYAIGGNHDHEGNMTSQMEYSNISERWNFPDYTHNHVFEWKEEETTLSLEVIMIDTVNLLGAYFVSHDDPLYCAQPPGPFDLDVAASDWEWIEEKLKSSTADYLWVAGHYPVYSICNHGSTFELVRRLKPMLIEYGAHYLSGHDHCAVHAMDSEHGTHYVLTGI